MNFAKVARVLSLENVRHCLLALVGRFCYKKSTLILSFVLSTYI